MKVETLYFIILKLKFLIKLSNYHTSRTHVYTFVITYFNFGCSDDRDIFYPISYYKPYTLGVKNHIIFFTIKTIYILKTFFS